MAEWRNRIVGEGVEAPGDLLANPANWRVHPDRQRDSLGAVLDEVGWVQRVIVNRRTGFVLDGHLRVALAIERGAAEVPVVYVDLDEREEALMLAVLDPLSAMARTDQEALQALVSGISVDSMALRSFLQDLVADRRSEGLTDPDAVPVVQQAPYVQPGDLYVLGEHRVICGDATDGESYSRLLNDQRAEMMFTDPPYGIAYVGKVGSPRQEIKGDETVDVAVRALRLSVPCIEPGGAIYVAHSALLAPEFIGALRAERVHLQSVLVWVKNHHTFTRTDFKAKHEPILYAVADGADPRWYGEPAYDEAHDEFIYGWREDAAHRWRGGAKQTTVWEFDRPAASKEHPTMKPVALVERALMNNSRPEQVVLDPFLGSGTTLIAAERLGRRCYGMEIDPKYAQVAIERWEAFTGRKAEKHG
jgi:DNA modification methylase